MCGIGKEHTRIIPISDQDQTFLVNGKPIEEYQVKPLVNIEPEKKEETMTNSGSIGQCGVNMSCGKGGNVLMRGNKMSPDPNATGPHSVQKFNEYGQLRNYETCFPNPFNPTGFDSVKRVDLEGRFHKGISTPHVDEGKKIRPARKNEIP